MGLNLSNIYQRPYIKNEPNFVRRKRDNEEGSNAARQTSKEEETSQNRQSRGLLYTAERADEFKKSTPVVDGQQWQKDLYIKAQKNVKNSQITTAVDTSAPEHAVSGNSINIAQILKDFKNTSVAIGTPDELKEEVEGYLSLIEKQVAKDEPNKRLIKSNLKNASTILDNYISETLNKDSKVVENWVDALFMQDINFKYNEEEINPQFLVKFPQRENTTPAERSSVVDDIPADESANRERFVSDSKIVEDSGSVQTKVHIPDDSELKSLFIKSKRLAYANEPKKAIENFRKALTRADEVGDVETKSKIFYEIGKIYDDYNYPAQALTSYHKSIENTKDDNIKTRAHYSMAQIYDDVNQIEPALEHYFVSAAYGGETDNKSVQSTSLAKMGNIFSDMYEDDAFEYLSLAKELSADTDNNNVKGFVSSSLARAYERFGEPQEALKSYSDAVKNYAEAESPTKTARNYLSAADIMLDFNSNNKARGLLTKAQKYATEANDEALLREINNRLEKLAA